MSHGSSPPTPRQAVAADGQGVVRWRTIVLTLVAVVVVLAAVLVPGRPDEGRPLDPRSTGPEGLAGVVELLRGLDVAVELSLDVPSSTSTTVFVAEDLLGDARRDALLAWVEGGGTLVVADAGSRLHGLASSGGAPADLFGSTTVEPDCDLAAVAEVATVRHSAWQGLVAPEDVAGAVATCFPVGDDGAWLVAVERGEGTVVALGSPDPLVNRLLGEADNAVLAVALLGPAPGDRLVVAPRPPVGEGDVGLADLVPAGFWRGLILGLVALILAIVWRARRLGPPVAERLPPVLPSAELARSIADLLQRAGDHADAAARLRADTRDIACRALGLPAATADAQLASVLTVRTGLAADVAQLAVAPTTADADATLMQVAGACQRVRAALLRPGPGGHAQSRQTDRSGHR